MRIDTKTGLKTCSCCKIPKLPSYFASDMGKFDGLQSECRKCHTKTSMRSQIRCAFKKSKDISELMDELCQDPETKALIMELEK